LGRAKQAVVQGLGGRGLILARTLEAACELAGASNRAKATAVEAMTERVYIATSMNSS
jgi:hypothetical protein